MKRIELMELATAALVAPYILVDAPEDWMRWYGGVDGRIGQLPEAMASRDMPAIRCVALGTLRAIRGMSLL